MEVMTSPTDDPELRKQEERSYSGKHCCRAGMVLSGFVEPEYNP